MTVALIDAVADFVNFRNLVPRKNLADVVRREKTTAYSIILSVYT